MDQPKTNVYFVYKNENLNEVDPLSGNIAIAVKGNDNYYSIYTRGSPTASNVYRTLSDPRDFLNTGTGDFRMFTLVGLPSSRRAGLDSILTACQFSSEGWPGNVLTEMGGHGLLNGAQKEDAIINRRSSTNVSYNRPHSQTNGA